MRRIVLGSLLVIAALAVVFGLTALGMPEVQDALVERIAAKQVAQRDDLFEGDGLRVILCGTASPLPHPTRAQACVLVIAGGRFWIVDAGARSSNNVMRWRLPITRMAGVLLTHFHSDHIGDLGEYNLQSWVMGRPGPLPVWGPPGVERIVRGFNEAYALDNGYRTAHHGAAIADPATAGLEARAFALPESGARPIFHSDGLTVSAFAVDHSPVHPAVGYRFEYAGRSVVISGDTARTQTVVEAARGADLLLHEAQANHMVAVVQQVAAEAGRERAAKIMSDIPDYHTSPVETAEIAAEAGVGMLAMYHLTPPPPNRVAERIFTRGVDEVATTPWVLADDGSMFTLAAGSGEIEVGTVE